MPARGPGALLFQRTNSARSNERQPGVFRHLCGFQRHQSGDLCHHHGKWLPVVNTAQGHQNQNRLIRIVDTGSSPGTNYVAQTLAVAATTNEFFGGIDFTPAYTP